MKSKLRKKSRLFRNASIAGFGLLELKVAVGLIGIVTLAVLNLSSFILKQQNQTVLTATLLSTKGNLVAMLDAPGPWQKTIANSANQGTASAPGMECLISGSTEPCTSNGLNDPAYAIVNHSINVINSASGAAYYTNQSTTGSKLVNH